VEPPYPRPVAAAYQVLVTGGARQLVLLGASPGAAMALASAATLTPAPVGVVSLSAESTADDGSDPLAGAGAYHGPVLLAGTENDIYAPGGVTRRIQPVVAGGVDDGQSAGASSPARVSAPTRVDRSW